MRIFYKSWIFKIWPMKGYDAIVLGRWMLTRYGMDDLPLLVIRHEMVHQEQMDRHGIVMFYLIYLKDYFKNLWRYRNHDLAYRKIPFEVEAYGRQGEFNPRLPSEHRANV